MFRPMFGISLDKFLLIAVIAVLVIGPQRLPAYAAKLADLVRGLRALTDGAKERLKEEMGPEYDEVDWQRLDPRKYDPRRIIREALVDDTSRIPTPGFNGDIRPGDPSPVDPQPGDPQPGASEPGASQPGDSQLNGTSPMSFRPIPPHHEAAAEPLPVPLTPRRSTEAPQNIDGLDKIR